MLGSSAPGFAPNRPPFWPVSRARQDVLCLEGTASDYIVMLGSVVQDLGATGGRMAVPQGAALTVSEAPYKSFLSTARSVLAGSGTVPAVKGVEEVLIVVSERGGGRVLLRVGLCICWGRGGPRCATSGRVLEV